MVKLQIQCPSCLKSNFIEVAEDKIKRAARGVFAVNIAEGIICEHSFIAYVDKNFTVRDCFIADFQIELPESISEEILEEKRDLSHLFDLDLIKLNLTASLLGYILKAMIFKKKIILISDQLFLREQILNFFEYITQDLFDIDIEIIPEEEYEKESHGQHFAFKGLEIIEDFDGKIQSTTLNVEKTIVQKFLNEYEPMTSLIILKNEIQKAYKLSQTIVNFVQNMKKDEKVYSKRILNQISKKHNVKIAIPYLDFLYEIVENYFEVKIPKSSGISDFLGNL